MTSTLDDLREVLAERAATTSFDRAAARARFDARLTRRPTRRTRPLLIAAVAALVLGVVGAGVVAVAHDPRATAPTAGPVTALPLTDWLFTVRADALPADLDVVQYGHADAQRQVAVVLRPGDAATSDQVTALVELTVGAAARPSDATPDDGGWAAPVDDAGWGVRGWQVVWTDPSGSTLRAAAPDLATARVLRAATQVGSTHPVRFPLALPADWLPTGSRLRSIEFTGTQGADAVVDVPDAPALHLSVAAPGVYATTGRALAAVRTPFHGAWTSVAGGSLVPSVRILTSSLLDLRLTTGEPADPGPAVDDARLLDLVTGSRFAPFPLHPDQDAWYPVVDAFPTGR